MVRVVSMSMGMIKEQATATPVDCRGSGKLTSNLGGARSWVHERRWYRRMQRLRDGLAMVVATVVEGGAATARVESVQKQRLNRLKIP